MLGTERHESRRIDNQLRGRSGRQGDPGESRFYLSLGDELMRRFNGAAVESIMTRLNLPDDVPIEAGMVTKAIRSAQTQVEQQNFEIRKNVLKYDEVLNKQRTVIYDERRRVLDGENINEQIENMLTDVVTAYVDGATAEGYAEDWDLDKLWTRAAARCTRSARTAQELPARRTTRPSTSPATRCSRPCSPTPGRPTPGARPRSTTLIGAQGGMRELERQVLLQVMDRKWREHLYEMDYLKEGIGLRAMAQRDPLIEYQREGFDMFAAMLDGHQGGDGRAPVQRAGPGGAGRTARRDRRRPTARRRTRWSGRSRTRRSPRRPRPHRRPRPQSERTARVPARSGSGSGGRHAAPEGDPAATTSALPTVFSGGPRPASELQYSGPAEDGGTTTRSRSGAARLLPAVPAGAAASRLGTGRARAARAASTSTATGCRRPPAPEPRPLVARGAAFTACGPRRRSWVRWRGREPGRWRCCRGAGRSRLRWRSRRR